MVLGNLTLYAEWVDQNTSFYTVTFNAEGGTPEPEQQSIVENRKAQQPENPTKAGHIFDGWYTDATDEETRWNFAVDTVTSNTALYAKWAEAFTVTFDSNGGSAVPTLTRAAGEYVYLDGYRSATAKSGYIFDGWYTDQALTQPTGYYIQITENITLYARWLSSSDLAPHAGVWRRVWQELQEGGTATIFVDKYYTWTEYENTKENISYYTDPVICEIQFVIKNNIIEMIWCNFLLI